MSVGTAYALVCAARHPDRVRAVGLAAGPDGRRQERGTVEEVVARFRPELEEWVARVRPDDPDDHALSDRFLADLPSADATLLRATRTPTEVAASVREALADHDGYLAMPPDLPTLGRRPRRRPLSGAHLAGRPRAPFSILLAGWPEILAALR